jgi:hypothetical protein
MEQLVNRSLEMAALRPERPRVELPGKRHTVQCRRWIQAEMSRETPPQH